MEQNYHNNYRTKYQQNKHFLGYCHCYYRYQLQILLFGLQCLDGHTLLVTVEALKEPEAYGCGTCTMHRMSWLALNI